ncbi:VOC family protein [Rhodococcus triatomae]|uniref:Catechol 2,3-dioxygenase n=1 Tax=Rhodococcus triatomae TaxID=300028 RepID=A0A1G8FQW8_9NOCA|nr:VOC family protein [Rhodococcus triatomae]QNG19547.1 VOC family protein [Rhodococcus triatomae]QNG24538.1 VOC family protein [Rhodococcus triatomae]SDH84346.1 Catechol 2,3-dioxygenase [Rhodococcus triatomae]
MIDHFGFPVSDIARSVEFYLDAFAPVGLEELQRVQTPSGALVGFGSAGHPFFWLHEGARGVQQELHFAFSAPSREAVDGVHERAVASGIEVLHAPRVWPEYHPGYYAVFLRDPNGHNVEAVHHTF